jgi:triacylglycerol lipase
MTSTTTVESPTRDAEVVLLLHGLLRGRSSLRALQRAFEGAAMRCECWAYASSRRGIQSHVRALARRCALLRDQGAERIHFVTHSLGGLIVRGLLQLEDHPPYIGRVVQIAPPNNGSEIACRVLALPGLRSIYGPAGQDLRDPAVVAQICAVPRVPLLIIAGTRSFDWRNPTSYVGRRVLEPPHDGTVTVAETRLPGAAALLCVDETHTFLASHPRAIHAALRFVQCGDVPPDADGQQLPSDQQQRAELPHEEQTA